MHIGIHESKHAQRATPELTIAALRNPRDMRVHPCLICKVSTRLVTRMVGSNHNQSADAHQREETRPSARDAHKRLLTLNEAGAYIGLSHWRVRSLNYSGQLAYVRLGRRILIDLQDLDGLIDSKKQRECVRQNPRREV